MMKYLPLIALVIIYISYIGATHLEVQAGEGSDAAKTQLQRIQEQAKHMRYGECWLNALEKLQAGCRRLTDEVQRRVAYAFARCHLQASGRNIPECPDDTPIMKCTDTEAIPDSAFAAYTEFFTHTQQICFHLQSQAWHEATENTISRLADNSADVADRLEQSSNVAKEMIARQNTSLKNQEILLQNEQRLRDSMDKSVLDVQRSHAETKAIISEQRALFSEVFDRVAVLQKTVLGEFSSIYTFGFYVGSTLMAYILTSTTRTSSARIWLFLILMVNAAAEHLITQYYVSPIDGTTNFGSLGAFVPELIYEQTWLCRKFFSGLALFVLLVCVWSYKDYNRINNALLNDIKRQNEQLQTYIKENVIHEQSNEKPSQISVFDNVSSGKKMLLEKHQSDIASVATLSHHDAHVTKSEADTTLCANDNDRSLIWERTDLGSEVTDCTFRESEFCDEDSDISSVTSIMTVSSKSTKSGSRRQVTAHIRSSRRSSTPLIEIPTVSDKMNSSSSNTTKRRSRRSNIVALLNDSELSHLEPPSDGIVVGGYNLRRRPASPLVNRSILERESVEDFSSMMHNLAAQSASKRLQITQHLSSKN